MFLLCLVRVHHYFLDYAEERVNIDKNEVHFQNVFCTSLVIFHFYRANAYCLKEFINFFSHTKSKQLEER